MKGVSYSKRAKRWNAYRTYNGVRYQNTTFKTEDEAMVWKRQLDLRLLEEFGAELPEEMRERRRVEEAYREKRRKAKAKAKAKAQAKRKDNDSV